MMAMQYQQEVRRLTLFVSKLSIYSPVPNVNFICAGKWYCIVPKNCQNLVFCLHMCPQLGRNSWAIFANVCQIDRTISRIFQISPL